MDVRQLECFRVVGGAATCHPGSRGARYAPAGAQPHMSRIQDELGVALFEQAGRSIRLTPAGTAFLRRTQRILSEYGDARRECRTSPAASPA